MSGGAAHGQSVLVPPVEMMDRSAPVETAADNVVGSVSTPVLRRPSDQAEVYPLRWGPIQFHPYLSYQITYGDGLLQGTNANAVEKTTLNAISPGVFMELGQRWALDAAVTRSEYSNRAFEDNTGYLVALRGRIPGEVWSFNFGYVSSLTEETQVETATQDTLNAHLLTASATRAFRNRLSLELGLSQDVRLSKEQSDYWTWSTVNWLNYQATPKTAFGVGMGFGYNWVDPGSDWLFETLRGRVVWQPGPKLNAQLSMGAQFIQFEENDNTVLGASTDVFPLVGVSLAYQILQPTALTASAGHVIENSLTPDQYTEVTSFSVGLRQRFFEKFYLDLAPAYNFRTYSSTTGTTGITGANGDREDSYLSFDVQLGTVLFKKLNTAVFYRFADNDSNEDSFAFQTDQVGFRIAYRY